VSFGTKISDDLCRFGWQIVRVLFVFNNIPALIDVFLFFLAEDACHMTDSPTICDKLTCFVLGG
jgi:hypothetical protein